VARYEPRDKFYRKAREKGLPSRAAFKLEELMGRTRLALRGARVIDLGCAPGGWLAILAPAVGAHGRVAGVDLVACRKFGPAVITLVDDIRAPGLAERLKRRLGGRADLVTSDLSPKLTGIAERDEARFDELATASLGVARDALRPGGAMIAKLFMGGAFKSVLARMRELFEEVEVTRVKASRPGSSELYVIARGLRAPVAGQKARPAG
jgi:23S rRNA (uridine2552-2'-O)-methyltransferase